MSNGPFGNGGDITQKEFLGFLFEAEIFRDLGKMRKRNIKKYSGINKKENIAFKRSG